MRECHEVELASRTASGVEKSGHRSGEDKYGDQMCDCARNKDGLVMRGDNVREEGKIMSLTPSLVTTIEDSLSTSGQRRRTPTTSTISTSSLSPSSTRSLTTLRRIASPPQSSATTIFTITTPPTHPLSPRSTSSSYTFAPTGYQSVVPTYPPLTSSSTTSMNWSSIGTKLGLGLGIPTLVLLTLVLTILLYRRQAHIGKHPHRKQHQQHQQPTPEMATISSTGPAYPRLHPVPSSRFSTAGDVVVTPAPGVKTPVQLYFPPPPSSPPAVPRRNSARLLAGPLNSHPPVRPASSIYDGIGTTRESSTTGGNGVGDVLAKYLDINPRYLDGLWNPGQVDTPVVPLPREPVARIRRQSLSVDVDHSPGGIDEVSPLSSSSSGRYMPARISVMSGLSPSNPVRTHSKRTT